MDRVTATRSRDHVRAVLAYDIVDDARRARAAEAALDFIARSQFSVYDGWLQAKELLPLWRAVQDVVKTTEDAALLIAFCRPCACNAGGLGAHTSADVPETGWII